MPELAPSAPAYIYRARCERVIDGDTLVARIDLGFEVSASIPIRLHGVNAPEHDKPGGPEATDFLRRLVAPTPSADENPPLLIQTFKDERSFARWVADIWVDGKSLSQAVIDAGHGVAFDVTGKTDHWSR